MLRLVLERDLVRQMLMMRPWRAHRGARGHAVVEDLRHYFLRLLRRRVSRDYLIVEVTGPADLDAAARIPREKTIMSGSTFP